MSFFFNMKVDVNPINEFFNDRMAKMPPIVRKHALNIQANAAKDAPLKTGYLRSTIAANEGKDELHQEITDGTNYGVFQELGTSRGVRAKHFLGGACEKEADPFFKDVAEVLK